MTETPSFGSVSKVVMDKAWYHLDPNTGAFNFDVSVSKMAEALQLPMQSTKEAIGSAFTPECLSQVEHQPPVPLLKALRGAAIVPHIWTVGDAEWQRYKYIKTDAAKYVPEDHYHCYDANKLIELERLIDTLTISNKQKRVIVVDDKWENIEGVRKIAIELKKKGIEMIDYHMNLNDPKADATAFFSWVLGQKSDAQTIQKELEVILDFDGVVANTDKVLKGGVVEKLLDLVNKLKQV